MLLSVPTEDISVFIFQICKLVNVILTYLTYFCSSNNDVLIKILSKNKRTYLKSKHAPLCIYRYFFHIDYLSLGLLTQCQ